MGKYIRIRGKGFIQAIKKVQFVDTKVSWQTSANLY
jgi:hypothetical protein